MLNRVEHLVALTFEVHRRLLDPDQLGRVQGSILARMLDHRRKMPKGAGHGSGGKPYAVTVDPSARFVFSVDSYSNNLVAYTIDPFSGI